MERPAILNRSMPSTAGATMSNPAFRIPTVSQSLDEEHNLHIWEKVCLIKSRFSRRFCTGAHISGQLLIFQGKTCSLDRAFTNSMRRRARWPRVKAGVAISTCCGCARWRSTNGKRGSGSGCCKRRGCHERRRWKASREVA
jgi:hypothetical protein